MPTYQTIRRLIPDLLNLYTVLKMAAVLIHSAQTTHQTTDPQTYRVRRLNRQYGCLDTKYNFILYFILYLIWRFKIFNHCQYKNSCNHMRSFCRASDKSLARPGRKQANVPIRIEWISFGALPCRGGGGLVSRSCWNRARPCHASVLVSFLVGLRTYQHPGKLIHCCCIWFPEDAQ